MKWACSIHRGDEISIAIVFAISRRRRWKSGSFHTFKDDFESPIWLIRDVHLETGVIFYPVCCPADYFFWWSASSARATPERYSRPSRERTLYMGGPFFLRMHYISLVKFTLRTTGASQTVGFVNCTRWPVARNARISLRNEISIILIFQSLINGTGRPKMEHDWEVISLSILFVIAV